MNINILLVIHLSFSHQVSDQSFATHRFWFNAPNGDARFSRVICKDLDKMAKRQNISQYNLLGMLIQGGPVNMWLKCFSLDWNSGFNEA